MGTTQIVIVTLMPQALHRTRHGASGHVHFAMGRRTWLKGACLTQCRSCCSAFAGMMLRYTACLTSIPAMSLCRYGASVAVGYELAGMRKRMFAASEYEPQSTESRPGHQRQRKLAHRSEAPARQSVRGPQPRSFSGPGTKRGTQRKAFADGAGTQRER